MKRDVLQLSNYTLCGAECWCWCIFVFHSARILLPLVILSRCTKSAQRTKMESDSDNSSFDSDNSSSNSEEVCTWWNCAYKSTNKMTPNQFGPFFSLTEVYMALMMLEDSDQTTPEHSILTLTDDCIHKILGFLRVSDLASIAETCIRLQTIACSVFAREHSVLDLVRCEGGWPVRTPRRLQRILVNFGSLIKELRLESLHLVQFPHPGLTQIIQIHRLENLQAVYLDGSKIRVEDNKETLERVCSFSFLTNLCKRNI